MEQQERDAELFDRWARKVRLTTEILRHFLREAGNQVIQMLPDREDAWKWLEGGVARIFGFFRPEEGEPSIAQQFNARIESIAIDTVTTQAPRNRQWTEAALRQIVRDELHNELLQYELIKPNLNDWVKTIERYVRDRQFEVASKDVIEIEERKLTPVEHAAWEAKEGRSDQYRAFSWLRDREYIRPNAELLAVNIREVEAELRKRDIEVKPDAELTVEITDREPRVLKGPREIIEYVARVVSGGGVEVHEAIDKLKAEAPGIFQPKPAIPPQPPAEPAPATQPETSTADKIRQAEGALEHRMQDLGFVSNVPGEVTIFGVSATPLRHAAIDTAMGTKTLDEAFNWLVSNNYFKKKEQEEDED